MISYRIRREGHNLAATSNVRTRESAVAELKRKFPRLTDRAAQGALSGHGEPGCCGKVTTKMFGGLFWSYYE